MERSPDDLLVERSLDDELPDDEYVRTHGTEIKEPPYEECPGDPQPRDEGDDLPYEDLTPRVFGHRLRE